jgi:nucleoside-diphosphate-sugar epimerase
MADILLLGGSGFLSGTCARSAIREGHRVWTVTRGQRPMTPGTKSIVADRKDRPAFAKAIQSAGAQWDLVIDCIGYSGDDARQDINCFTGRAKHLVFISTDSVIDPFSRPWKIDETYAKFHNSPYALGKREAEEVLLASSGELPITILRPCHIYGPGSQLGCIPQASRDPQLIDRLRREEPITLVGAGHFLQHPIYAEDLWLMAQSCLDNSATIGQIYFAAGPDVVECRVFYQYIAEILGVDLTIREIAVDQQLREHPDTAHFCSHRVYTLDKARNHGLILPATPLCDGLRIHVESMIAGKT